MTDHRDERGAALIMALMLVVLLGTVSTLALERNHLVISSTEQQSARLATLFAAEGGVAHARHALARHPDHAGTRLEIGACTVVTTVTAYGVRGWNVTVEARPTAQPRQRRCRVEVELRRTVDGLPAITSWLER